MLILGLDLETTGLNVGEDLIIEVGAVLWDWSRSRPLKILNQLVQIDGDLSPEISQITGIESADLKRFGEPLAEVLADLHDLAREAKFIAAHNGNQFDRLFLERDWIQLPESRIHLEWIDTLTDVPYPPSMGTRKLSYLAAEHGFLNPFSHRAAFDVLSMLKILSQYEPEKVLQLRESPLRRVVAQVSYDNREQAKGEGFRWDPGQRHWYLEGKQVQLEGRKFPFPVLWL